MTATEILQVALAWTADHWRAGTFAELAACLVIVALVFAVFQWLWPWKN